MKPNCLTHRPLVPNIYASVNWEPLVQVMACHLSGTKPLLEPMLSYCHFRLLGMNFSEIWIETQNFSFMKMHLKMLSVKWRPFCPGTNGQITLRHALIHSDNRMNNLVWCSYSSWQMRRGTLLLSVWTIPHQSGQAVDRTSWGHFYQHGLILIAAWISNYIHQVWDEITYPFQTSMMQLFKCENG